MNNFRLREMYIGSPNESGTALKIPPFEEKNDCVCSYGVLGVLRMHAISSVPAICVCDTVRAH